MRAEVDQWEKVLNFKEASRDRTAAALLQGILRPITSTRCSARICPSGLQCCGARLGARGAVGDRCFRRSRRAGAAGSTTIKVSTSDVSGASTSSGVDSDKAFDIPLSDIYVRSESDVRGGGPIRATRLTLGTPDRHPDRAEELQKAGHRRRSGKREVDFPQIYRADRSARILSLRPTTPSPRTPSNSNRR